MPIRILLLDDHALFRESLARLLESEHGLKVVASCATVDEAQLVTSSQPVDLVLLDFELGQERGSAFVHWAQAAGYPGRILAVTAGLHEADTLELLRSGVAGVFLKHSAPASLIHAIHQVMSGLAWLDQKSVLQIARSAEPTAQDFAP